MAKHSRRFPPSASKRWLTCARSVSFIESLPAVERRPSAFAAQGSAAHAVGEAVLQGMVLPKPGDTIQMDGYAVPIDREMLEHAQDYAQLVRNFEQQLSGTTYTEVGVTLDALVGKEAECIGTCDSLVVGSDTMAVIDLKYGRGIEVDIEDNPQLQIYALGALLDATPEVRDRIERVVTVIFQPRVPGGQPIKAQSMYALDLLMWGTNVVKPAIARIMSGEADTDPFVTSDECRFCPAAAHCPGLKQRAQDLARKAFGSVPILEVAANLSDSELADALDESEIVKYYIDAVATEALLRAKTGKDIPRRKLVAKRGVRQWIDPSAAELKALELGADRSLLFTPPQLKSPAQVAILVDKASRKDLTPFSKMVSSGVSLVKASDPRPAVPVETATAAFGGSPVADDQDEE